MEKQTINNIIKFLDRVEVQGIQDVEKFHQALQELRQEYQKIEQQDE